jgi:hypothetical protein
VFGVEKDSVTGLKTIPVPGPAPRKEIRDPAGLADFAGWPPFLRGVHRQPTDEIKTETAL